MAETSKNDFLENERIGKLMWKYAVPCVISMLVAALYNIVDQIFIANAVLLPMIWGLYALSCFMPVADTLTFIAVAFILLKTKKELEKETSYE